MNATSERREPTEEELRAFEEQLRNLKVGEVVIQTAVSLINLAGRRLGLSPGAEAERDLGQVRDAIDAVRALMPVLERGAPADVLKPLREAISQLQLEYARLAQAGADAATKPAEAGTAPQQAPAEGQAEKEGERPPGPAEASGRLWVPGR
jgi:hypothetical protein